MLGLPRLEEINNLYNIDTSNVTNMSCMFGICNSLTILDLSSFNTSKVTDMSHMFHMIDDWEEKIKTIIVGSGWTTNAVTNSEYMFHCNRLLTGEYGTKFNWDHNDATYAHIDEGESNPGYFSSKPEGDRLVLWNELYGKTYDEFQVYDSNTDTNSFTNTNIEFVSWTDTDDEIIKYNNNYYKILYDNDYVVFSVISCDYQ